MSHKATMWLAGLEPDRITSGGFRVLFHLCDCHNPARGCFPSQEYLRRATGLSNGGLNNALKALEDGGLIRRHRRVDGATRKQRPTQYHLAFEVGFTPADQGSEAEDEGGSDCAKPSPDSGDGPVSTFSAIPSPLSERSRLHSTGDKPVKEPVRNRRARKTDASEPDTAAFWAERIKAGKTVRGNPITAALYRELLRRELCTEAEMKRAGVAV